MEKSDGTERRFVTTDHGLFYLDAAAMTDGHSADHGTACIQAVGVQTGVRVDSASHVDGATVSGVDDEPTDMAEDNDNDEDDSTYQQSSDAEADLNNDLFDSDSHTDGATAAGDENDDTDVPDDEPTDTMA
jgi:hypothetical protein